MLSAWVLIDGIYHVNIQVLLVYKITFSSGYCTHWSVYDQYVALDTRTKLHV
jgi:hypothetical protein